MQLITYAFTYSVFILAGVREQILWLDISNAHSIGVLAVFSYLCGAVMVIYTRGLRLILSLNVVGPS